MSEYEQESGEGESGEYGGGDGGYGTEPEYGTDPGYDTGYGGGTDTGYETGNPWENEPGQYFYDASWNLDAGFHEEAHSWETLSADGGTVEFEFVNAPTLNGEEINYSYKTKNRAKAMAGSTVAHIAVMKGDNELIGTGNNKLGTDMGPNDVAEATIRPLRYTASNGDYSISVSISGDARAVRYHVQNGAVTAR